jgi:tRNA(Ile)-lysidine synthase
MAEPRPVALLAASPLWERLDGGTLAVACSGGRDSVALARAAHMLLSDGGFCSRFDNPPVLHLWHMDHGLREDSARDAELVEQLAAQLSVKCPVARLNLSAELAENGGNTEELARKLRYEELLRWLQAKPPAGPKQPALAATAHHLGDQTETIIFNLVRGTHIAGLRGIAPLYEERIYRPWLALAPEEITAFLGELKQGYVDDPGNTDTKLARVKLRRVSTSRGWRTPRRRPSATFRVCSMTCPSRDSQAVRSRAGYR